MTTVTWVQDGNGNYEISSAEHLKQLMNRGSLYTNAGSPPSSAANYWASGTNYIQTVDIDLLSDSTDIRTIGDNFTQFEGIYDGGNYTISNWSFVDPFYLTTPDSRDWIGLFGYARNGTLKNIRLGGIFDLKGFHESAGLLVGRAFTEDIHNIVCDFDAGTTVTRGSATTSTSSLLYIGCVIGNLNSSSAAVNTVTGIELKGTVDFVINGSVSTVYAGGVVGFTGYSNLSLISNSATISGLTGRYSAGITSWLNASTVSKCISSMTGDLQGSIFAGGIIGGYGLQHSTTNVVNAMTGNIVNTGTNTTSGVGGIATLLEAVEILLEP